MNKHNIFEYIECNCHSPEHTISFGYEPSSNNFPPMLYMSVSLQSHNNIFKRIWFAIKYIFGYRCRFGHFDEFVFTPESAKIMIRKLGDYVNETNNFYKTKPFLDPPSGEYLSCKPDDWCNDCCCSHDNCICDELTNENVKEDK